MSGYLAACGTYYADRRREPCLACRGTGKLAKSKEPCKCAGCRKGLHMTANEVKYGTPPKPRSTNSDLFTGSRR